MNNNEKNCTKLAFDQPTLCRSLATGNACAFRPEKTQTVVTISQLSCLNPLKKSKFFCSNVIQYWSSFMVGKKVVLQFLQVVHFYWVLCWIYCHFFLPRSLDNDTPNSEAVRNSLLESATQMVAIRNRAWDFLLLAKIQCNYVQYWPGFFLWNLLYIFCSFYHPGQKYRFLPFEFYCIEYACL